MRKTFIFFLALAATTSLFAKGTKIGNLYYVLYDSDLTAQVCYNTRTTANYQDLTSVSIPNTVTYNSKTYTVNVIDELAFADAPNLQSVYIGNNVVTIRANAFLRCTKLNTLLVGEKVQSFGLDALKDCSNLHTVYWQAINYPDCGIYDTPFLRDKDDYAYNFNVANYITDVTFGNNVKHIPANLCAFMHNLKSIVIPDGVINIGDRAFRACDGLTTTTVTLPNSVTYLGDFVFLKTNISAPVYNNRIFAYYPPSIEESSYAIPNGIETIAPDAFHDCNYLKSISIPTTVKYIEAGAISYCGHIESITLPNSVLRLGMGAFQENSALKSINFPNSIIECGTGVFYGTALTDPVYNEHVYAYMPPSLLVAATWIPEGIKLIAGGAFLECSELQSITIPSAVDSIGDNAFEFCHGLKEVSCKAVTPPALGEDIFYDVSISEIPLYVPAGSVEAYKAADQWKDFKPIEAINTVGITSPSHQAKSEKSTKVIRDGQVLIINDNKLFNLHGAQVK